jgi:hypothetical protein
LQPIFYAIPVFLCRRLRSNAASQNHFISRGSTRTSAERVRSHGATSNGNRAQGRMRHNFADNRRPSRARQAGNRIVVRGMPTAVLTAPARSSAIAIPNPTTAPAFSSIVFSAIPRSLNLCVLTQSGTVHVGLLSVISPLCLAGPLFSLRCKRGPREVDLRSRLSLLFNTGTQPSSGHRRTPRNVADLKSLAGR